ncbi:MAG TPA: lytic transglycosylase domain-containing protein [Allosphingosinicella sp.]|jgi:soluble lytic murein transglycosylase-like protein
MIKRSALLLAAAALSPTLPAAADVPVAAASRSRTPAVLTDAQRVSYREIFAAVRSADWATAASKLDAMEPGPLHAAARAELYLAKGSPKVELEPLLALIASAPELPHAAQLARLAAARGAEDAPTIVEPQKLYWQGSQPRRERARSLAAADPAAAKLDAIVQPLIVADQPSEAEAQLALWAEPLTPEILTELRQRIAWSYYLVGRDADARRLAEQAALGTGEWALQGSWALGLAAWRQGDCAAAANAFSTVASRASDVELGTAGHYWAARADMRCKRPERVQQRLRAASRSPETFYGLLAAEALGIKTPVAKLHDYRDSEWRSVAEKPNVKAALALLEIGEPALADEHIRHQARLGSARDHDALLHLAADLNLTGTQYWLAHNGPKGASINIAARYPMPDWQPARGWRVDQSLVFAHALQESNFRPGAVSPAGAAGLLQVRPGTAGDIARTRGEPFDTQRLVDPVHNIEYGQTFIEMLRDKPGTGGLLPKVIAAYNAGPVPIAEWNSRAMAGGDPLLYIESIPYWETRGYVPIVLRNYWIYEQQAGKNSSSRHALAQGMWPRFPGLPGASAVRMQERRTAEVSSGAATLP